MRFEDFIKNKKVRKAEKDVSLISALVSTYKNESVIADKFDRFRKIRNKINYYGEDISIEEVKENSEQIKKLTIELRNKYLGEFL